LLNAACAGVRGPGSPPDGGASSPDGGVACSVDAWVAGGCVRFAAERFGGGAGGFFWVVTLISGRTVPLLGTAVAGASGVVGASGVAGAAWVAGAAGGAGVCSWATASEVARQNAAIPDASTAATFRCDVQDCGIKRRRRSSCSPQRSAFQLMVLLILLDFCVILESPSLEVHQTVTQFRNTPNCRSV
jgi:hypothetical protein